MYLPTRYILFFFVFTTFVATFFTGTADIFRGFMVSLYVKGKENGHVQAYAPTGAKARP